MKSLSLRACASVALAAWSLTALAMPVGTDCMLGDVTATGRGDFDACVGSIAGNEAGHNAAVLMAEINSGNFDGITNWSWDATANVGGSTEGPNTSGLSINPSADGNTGSWSISPATADAVVISLKAGNFWSAYYFAAGEVVDGGTWTTDGVAVNPNGAGASLDLSHATIAMFTPTATAMVSEPGTLALLLGGLLALGFRARGRR